MSSEMKQVIEPEAPILREARRRIRVWLASHGWHFTDLAALSGLGETTIYDVLSGRSSSTRSRQILTNAIGEEIFPGMMPTEQRVTFPAGTETDFADDESAAAFTAGFASYVERVSERKFIFIRPLSIRAG
jgi:hypothetical protein